MFNISRFILNAQTKKTAAEETGAVYYRGARVDKQFEQVQSPEPGQPSDAKAQASQTSEAGTGVPKKPKTSQRSSQTQHVLVRDLPETRSDKRFAPLIGRTFAVVRALETPTGGRRYCVEIQPGQLLWLLENQVEVAPV